MINKQRKIPCHPQFNDQAAVPLTPYVKFVSLAITPVMLKDQSLSSLVIHAFYALPALMKKSLPLCVDKAKVG
jgi:hypothetical protein